MKRLARYIEIFIVNPWMRSFGGDILMRLKSLFVGGLSFLMLGLFPTAVWASEEGRPVEMSVAAVKQYYRDRDYVSLFDALVFAGGEYTKVMRPTEIFIAKKIYSHDQYDYLKPALSKVGKVHFLGNRQPGPIKDWPVPKTAQEVLSSGGLIILSMAMGGKNFEKEFWAQREKVRSMFPQTENFKGPLSTIFDELKLSQKVATNLSNSGQLSKDGWFSCSHIRVGHTFEGTPRDLSDAPRQSVISAWMFGGRFPRTYQTLTCFQQDFLFAVGLLGSSHPQLEKIHLISDRKVGIGPVLKCALDLLYHPAISDGMDREKALSALTALPKEELHCE